MISYDLLLHFNVSFVKSWFYSDLMESEFYLNQRLNEKRMQKLGFELGIFWLRNQCHRKHSHQGFTLQFRTFDELLQLSST